MSDLLRVVNDSEADLKKKGKEKEAKLLEQIKELREQNSDLEKEIKTLREKIPQAALYKHIYDSIENRADAEYGPAPFHLGVFEEARGIKQPYIITPLGECELLNSLTKVRQKILEYTLSLIPVKKSFALTSRQAGAAADYWLDLVHPKPRPMMIREHEDLQPCLRRIPWPLCPDPINEMTPLFDEFYSRCDSNVKQMRAWIWSLFEEDAYTQQLLWLQGGGGDGKGSVMRALHKVFGQLSVVQNDFPSENNKHWAWGYKNKRFIGISDARKNTRLDSSVIKSLTGGDPLNVDPKGGEPYMMMNKGKVMVASNYLPIQDGTEAELRRPIIVSVRKPVGKRRSNYDNELFEELPFELYKCKLAYQELCPDNGEIEVDPEGRLMLSDDLEERNPDLGNFFRMYFTEQKDSFVTPDDITNLVYSSKRDVHFNRRFNEWLKNKGFKPIRPRDKEGKRLFARFEGLKFNPTTTHNLILSNDHK